MLSSVWLLGRHLFLSLFTRQLVVLILFYYYSSYKNYDSVLEIRKKGEKYWSLPRYCCTCCGFTYWNSLGHNFKHKNGANLRTQIFGETYRYCWIKFMFLFDCQHIKERSLTGQIFTSTKMYSFLDGSLFTRRNWSHIRKPYMLFIYSLYLFI